MNQIYIRGNEIATKKYVDGLSLGGDGSALENYYTKEEVNTLIENSDGGNVDLSSYYTKEEINNIIAETNNSIQVEEMPDASADNLGTVVQYIGDSNEYYTTGYFYQVIEETIINEDGTETIIYKWEEIKNPEINLDEYATKKYVDDNSRGPIKTFEITMDMDTTSTNVIYHRVIDDSVRVVLNELVSYAKNTGSDFKLVVHNTSTKSTASPSVELYMRSKFNEASDKIILHSSYYYGQKYYETSLDINFDKTTGLLLENDSDIILQVHTFQHSYLTEDTYSIYPTGTYYFNKKLPQSSLAPTSDVHLVNKKYVDDTIATSIAEISATSMEIATSLPTENISTSTIYLIKDEAASTDTENIYNEYIYINGA